MGDFSRPVPGPCMRGLLLAGWLASFLACDQPEERALPELELSLEEVIPVPPSWTVREFLPLRDRSILFVLHPQGELRWWPDSASAVRMPTRVIVGARQTSDGTIELLDRTHGELVRVSHQSRGVIETQPIDIDSPIWDAAWAGEDHWLVLAGDSAASPVVYSVSGDGRSSATGPPVKGLTSRLARLSLVASRPLVTELTPPFRVFALAEEGWRQVIPTDRLSLPRGSTALDALELGPIALQVLVDQTTRRRVLRLFSLESGEMQARTVEAPLSLTLSDANWVWGIRSLEREELVKYSWRWR